MFKNIMIAVAMIMLSLVAQVGAANANLVVNGGFETGDLTSWNTSADLIGGVAGDFAHSGNYAAAMSAGTISQDISTTAGKSYIVSYWLANDAAGTNSFTALWNNSLAQVAMTNAGVTDYTKNTFQAVATGATSTISFSATSDNSFFHVDDVSATPTPIPAAAWLLGSGLMGLVGLRRRKQK